MGAWQLIYIFCRPGRHVADRIGTKKRSPLAVLSALSAFARAGASILANSWAQ